MQIKDGVDLRGIRPEMTAAFPVIKTVFNYFGAPAILTCGVEGEHMEGSLHPKGFATDWRVWHVPLTRYNTHVDLYNMIVTMLKRALGDQYDVVLEGTPHIHIEFDPT